MSALPLGRYRQLLHQLLELNEQAAALRRELTAMVDADRRTPTPEPPRHFLDGAEEGEGEGEGEGAEEGEEAGGFGTPCDVASVRSFSSAGSSASVRRSGASSGGRSLLELLSRCDADADADVSDCLLEMSASASDCEAMRRAGCVRLLVRLVHSKRSAASRAKASRALRNLVCSQPDDKAGRREVRVLRLLETVGEYCRELEEATEAPPEHPAASVAALMKLSFDEEHRHAMCRLGALQALAALVAADQKAHGNNDADPQCVTVRKYSGMALTNLTFGDGDNKALLCSFRDFMLALVDQLRSQDDDMRQVTAAVLRNLSWRADSASKQMLREAGAVKGLTLAAMSSRKEATLKSVLSALWNLTAHCSLNKVDICSVDGALAFLVRMLAYDAPSKTLAIVENAGGILRNVSSHIAVREDYRQILRERDCLKVLLRQLESPSLTVVSNSCGTLWNLSARCERDQRFLWDRGAVPLLRSLVRSKHKMIAMGSGAALKNLLNSEPGKDRLGTYGGVACPSLPTLGVRKRRALEHEIDPGLSETCENIEPNASPATKERDERMLLTAAERRLSAGRMSSSSPLIGQLDSRAHRSRSGRFDDRSGFGSGFSRNFAAKAHVGGCGSAISAQSDTAYEKASRRDGRGSDDSVAFEPETRAASEIRASPEVGATVSDFADEAERYVRDRPIDYSKKYAETRVVAEIVVEPDRTAGSPFLDEEASGDDPIATYGDYRETDLDQPTDYSLRYCEEHSDTASSASESRPPSVHQDTIKHFCTEGTPYETPLNFSTATSVSDLRGIGTTPDKSDVKPAEGEVDRRRKEAVEIMSGSDEKDSCSLEERDEAPKVVRPSEPKAVQFDGADPVAYDSEYASGVSSPEKPTNYCEEGTPGYFSRVSSLSSLEGVGDVNLSEFEKEPESAKSVDSSEKVDDEEDAKTDLPPEATALEATTETPPPPSAQYAEETPLMFSRCSSLGSLSECSVPEPADDVGSVLSEFSRLPSGVVSPSELPDSPTQPLCSKTENPNLPCRSVKIFKTQIQSTNKLRSVFEDEVATFHFDHTPAGLSSGTSLSSLTIDDDPTARASTSRRFSSGERSEGVGCSHPVEFGRSDDRAEARKDDLQPFPSVRNYNTDRIFKECIKAGVQSRIKAKVDDERLNPATSGGRVHEDACLTYCTEDTPAQLSKAGSRSDLSVLSVPEMDDIAVCVTGEPDFRKNDTVPQEKKKPDTGSRVGDDLLAGCIRSGIHKTPYLPAVDEFENYAIEGSPFRHSLCSSLSDLTVASGDQKARLVRRFDTEAFVEKETEKESNSPRRQRSPAGSLSSVSICSDDDRLLNMAIQAGVPRPNGHPMENADRSEDECDGNDSLSSLSVDSAESDDCEEALFEQCIMSGLPRIDLDKWDGVRSKTLDKNYKTGSRPAPPDEPRDSAESRSLEKCDDEFESLVATGAFGKCPASETIPKKQRTEIDSNAGSKNGTATSVVATDICSATEGTQIATSDVNATKESEETRDTPGESLRSNVDASPNLSFGTTNGCEGLEAERSALGFASQRDVDLTVSSVSAGERPNDTWNGSALSDDAAFPTVSGSAPAVPSFRSDVIFPDDEVENLGNRFFRFEPFRGAAEDDRLRCASIDSAVIEDEANRLATLMDECRLEESGHSLLSLDFDSAKLPSLADSSTSPPRGTLDWDDGSDSDRLPGRRKKSLPRCIVARKALGLSLSQGRFFESDNLESVRPPSEMDDMESSMLSVASIASEAAEAPSVEERTTPEKEKKSPLTPRQKRQVSGERYKTYTIALEPGAENGGMEIPPREDKKSSPKQKRQEDKARYQTRTVTAEDLPSAVMCESPSSRKSLKQKRIENSDRYRTQVLEADCRSALEAQRRSDSPIETDYFRSELMRDAAEALLALRILPADESSTVDLDCETISLVSEDDSELNSLRMKTFTRSFRNYLPVIESPTSVDRCIEKNLKNIDICALADRVEIERPEDFNSLECDQNSGTESADQYQNSDSDPEASKVKGKPAIRKPENVKSSEGSVDSEEGVPKGIRGRRRAPYVSPYKRTGVPTKKSPARNGAVASKHSKIGAIPARSLNGFARKLVDPVAEIDQILSKRNAAIPQKPATRPKPPPLVRQGTFTKENHSIPASPDAPEPAGLPINIVPKVSQLQKPASVKSYVSKLNKRTIETGAAKVRNGRGPATPDPKRTLCDPKPSSSEHSLHSDDSVKTVMPSRKNLSADPPKSIAKKDATSKVASLWKRVEESKRAQPKRDARVWIKGAVDEVAASPATCVRSKLIRSSTFEGSKSSAIPTPLKQKSSISIKETQQTSPPYKYGSRVPVMKSLSKVS